MLPGITPALMAAKSGAIIRLTVNGTWIVPPDWDNARNIIECIGPGGNGAAGQVNRGGGGGGGGAYTYVKNVTLTPSSSIAYTVSPSTIFRNSAGTIICASGGGSPASGNIPGGAGNAGAGTGFNGGNGGNGGASDNPQGGGGGGGSAGPLGVGGVGALGGTTSLTGGVGGTGNGGTVAGGTTSGGNGVAGTNIDGVAGAGSGGGGGSGSVKGGNGGAYGAGGGGGYGHFAPNIAALASDDVPTQYATVGGTGAPGIIVIRYGSAAPP